jgi:hypothetical protein
MKTIKILILSSLILLSIPKLGFATVTVTAEILGSCGNNLKEIYEDCDGTDFGSSTCQSIGYASGDLGCSDVCTYNTEQCVAPVVTTPTNTGIQSGGSVLSVVDNKINYSNVTFGGTVSKNGLLTIVRNSEVIVNIQTFAGKDFTYVDTEVLPGLYTYTLTHSEIKLPQSFPVQVRAYQNIQIQGIDFKTEVVRNTPIPAEAITPVQITPEKATGTIGIGQIVKLNVVLPKQKEAIYGFSGTVKIPALASFKAIEYKNNLFVYWVQKPVYSEGIITFQARIPDGYMGVIDPNIYPNLDDANLFTIVLESNKSGVEGVVVDSEIYPGVYTSIAESGKSSYELKVSTYRYEDPAKEQYGTTTVEKETAKSFFTQKNILIISIIGALFLIGFILRFAI